MNCTHCGATLEPQHKFCPNCGRQAEPAPAVQYQPVPIGAANAPAYVSKPALPAPPVTAAQRYLLPGVLLLGIVLQATLFVKDNASFSVGYAVFWLAYIALFHAVSYKQALSRPLGFLLAGPAAFLCVMLILQSRGYSEESLLYLNWLAIPCLLMLHAQYVSYPLKQESGYLGLFFLGFVAQPFQYIGRFFRCIGDIARSDKGERRRVWLGILLAIPAVGVVLALLLSADAVMNAYAQEWFRLPDLSEAFFRVLIALICAMLFYSFLYGARWGQPLLEQTVKERKLWEDTAPAVVMGALLAVYALFTAVQFTYLFGGQGLPAGLTYARYAQEGFNQLMWVAALNFGLFSLCLSRAQKGNVLRALMFALLAATGVILASSFTRLLLYIGAYGLTFKRIQAFWFLCYLTAVLLLYAVRMFREKLPLLRISALLFVFWYAVLNVPDLTLLYAPGA